MKTRKPKCNCNGCGRWMTHVMGIKREHERLDVFDCSNCGRETTIDTPLVEESDSMHGTDEK